MPHVSQPDEQPTGRSNQTEQPDGATRRATGLATGRSNRTEQPDEQSHKQPARLAFLLPGESGGATKQATKRTGGFCLRLSARLWRSSEPSNQLHEHPARRSNRTSNWAEQLDAATERSNQPDGATGVRRRVRQRSNRTSNGTEQPDGATRQPTTVFTGRR